MVSSTITFLVGGMWNPYSEGSTLFLFHTGTITCASTNILDRTIPSLSLCQGALLQHYCGCFLTAQDAFVDLQHRQTRTLFRKRPFCEGGYILALTCSVLEQNIHF